jgi:hypothetical protein
VFGRLFGKKPAAAARGEDCVWMQRGARLAGIVREVDALSGADRSVVVVALTAGALDELCAALAKHEPARCADIFGRDSLNLSLAKPGAVAVALASALPAEPKSSGVPADVLVSGRNASRAADEAIERFADALGPNAHLAFHLALDDPLLQAFGASLKPLLEKLGMRDDEPIAHAMVTRAIRNAQEKAGA